MSGAFEGFPKFVYARQQVDGSDSLGWNSIESKRISAVHASDASQEIKWYACREDWTVDEIGNLADLTLIELFRHPDPFSSRLFKYLRSSTALLDLANSLTRVQAQLLNDHSPFLASIFAGLSLVELKANSEWNLREEPTILANVLSLAFDRLLNSPLMHVRLHAGRNLVHYRSDLIGGWLSESLQGTFGVGPRQDAFNVILTSCLKGIEVDPDLARTVLGPALDSVLSPLAGSYWAPISGRPQSFELIERKRGGLSYEERQDIEIGQAWSTMFFIRALARTVPQDIPVILNKHLTKDGQISFALLAGLAGQKMCERVDLIRICDFPDEVGARFNFVAKWNSPHIRTYICKSLEVLLKERNSEGVSLRASFLLDGRILKIVERCWDPKSEIVNDLFGLVGNEDIKTPESVEICIRAVELAQTVNRRRGVELLEPGGEFKLRCLTQYFAVSARVFDLDSTGRGDESDPGIIESLRKLLEAGALLRGGESEGVVSGIFNEFSTPQLAEVSRLWRLSFRMRRSLGEEFRELLLAQVFEGLLFCEGSRRIELLAGLYGRASKQNGFAVTDLEALYSAAEAAIDHPSLKESNIEVVLDVLVFALKSRIFGRTALSEFGRFLGQEGVLAAMNLAISKNGLTGNQLSLIYLIYRGVSDPRAVVIAVQNLKTAELDSRFLVLTTNYLPVLRLFGLCNPESLGRTIDSLRKLSRRGKDASLGCDRMCFLLTASDPRADRWPFDIDVSLSPPLGGLDEEFEIFSRFSSSFGQVNAPTIFRMFRACEKSLKDKTKIPGLAVAKFREEICRKMLDFETSINWDWSKKLDWEIPFIAAGVRCLDSRRVEILSSRMTSLAAEKLSSKSSEFLPRRTVSIRRYSRASREQAFPVEVEKLVRQLKYYAEFASESYIPQPDDYRTPTGRFLRDRRRFLEEVLGNPTFETFSEKSGRIHLRSLLSARENSTCSKFIRNLVQCFDEEVLAGPLVWPTLMQLILFEAFKSKRFATAKEDLLLSESMEEWRANSIHFLSDVVLNRLIPRIFNQDPANLKIISALLKQSIRQLSQVDTSATRSPKGSIELRFAPTRGVLGEISGFICKTCWGKDSKSLFRNAPELCSVIFVGENRLGIPKFLGGALVAQANSVDGKRYFVIMGFNPTLETLKEILADELFDSFLDYLSNAAHARSISGILLPFEERCGNTHTNRLDVHEYFEQKYFQFRGAPIPLLKSKGLAVQGYDVSSKCILIKPISTEIGEDG